MDLSPEDNLQNFKIDSGSVSDKARFSVCDMFNDIIDVNEILFEDDEYWLYKLPTCGRNQIQSLKHWLQIDINCSNEQFPSDDLTNVSQNSFDSRTFTRPKKRFSRPGIEKYQETVYGLADNIITNDITQENNCDTSPLISKVLDGDAIKPLNFDLSQPSNSYYFENMLANIRETDSFQNMSPPSLVNSICSTTFANLMESSFIKNDPVLREIRDTDFTESILLQDSEAPMFQSITESCSSLNSDTPENFLKKVSRSDTFRKKSSFDCESNELLSNTFQVNLTRNLKTKSNKDSSQDLSYDETELEKTIVSVENVNETYHGTPKKKSSRSLKNVDQNSTFSVEPPFENLNGTKPLLIKRSLIRENTIEDLKKQLDSTVPTPDINRLSYCMDYKTDFNESPKLNKTIDMKRSSLSIGSTDSLDRMSSRSNSSRGSNRMLSMADVDAIVEMQEKSLQQVMSTPKVNSSPKKLWINNFISPITSVEHLSDSEVSSNEEYKSVKSSLSKASLEPYCQKSLDSINNLGDFGKKTMHLPTYGSAQNIPNGHKFIKSNYAGTMKSNRLRSEGTITTNSDKSNTKVSAPVTNLKSMGQKLKASYTSLKPISSNLPVVPPVIAPLDVTKTLPRVKNSNLHKNVESQKKVVEVPRVSSEKVGATDPFVKPIPPRSSCLPRPTGIPRPSTRIPAPHSNIRSAKSRSVTQTVETRHHQ